MSITRVDGLPNSARDVYLMLRVDRFKVQVVEANVEDAALLVAGGFASLWEHDDAIWMSFISEPVPDDYTWYDSDDPFIHESLPSNWPDLLETARARR